METLCRFFIYVSIVAASQLTFFAVQSSLAQYSAEGFQLIAHRGGVVDSNTAENSRGSIEKAIQRKYWMVELDLRVTRDRELIIHHDKDFRRYYGVDSLVKEMTWQNISMLRSNKGEMVLKFEEALKLCQGKIHVMVDNKIEGSDTALFAKVVRLLDKYSLRDSALMIGTTESTEFFTGKIKLSCTREQLEQNRRRSDYKPSNYYLFSATITPEDATWAASNGILPVGVLNRWAHRNATGAQLKQVANRLKATGVRHFQIDSEFEELFR